MVRGLGHVVDVQTEEDRGYQSNLSHPNPHASTRCCGRLEGRFEHPTAEVQGYSMDYVRQEV